MQGRHEPRKMVSVFVDKCSKLPLNVRIDIIEVINKGGFHGEHFPGLMAFLHPPP